MERRRGGRRPDRVIAEELGISVEELKAQRKAKLQAKQTEEIAHDQEFYNYFDPELNDIAAAIDECRRRMDRLIKCRSSEKKMNFLCKQFVDEIYKEGFDPEIVMGRVKILFEENKKKKKE